MRVRAAAGQRYHGLQGQLGSVLCADALLTRPRAGAGGTPSGGRVGDVYEVAGQLVKSVYYCDVTTLLDHMEDRMHTRHTSPSSFISGDLGSLRQLLRSTPATKLSFTVVGVQPGISRRLVDAHLADLMVFSVDYAKRGGTSRAYWLISE